MFVIRNKTILESFDLVDPEFASYLKGFIEELLRHDDEDELIDYIAALITANRETLEHVSDCGIDKVDHREAVLLGMEVLDETDFSLMIAVND